MSSLHVLTGLEDDPRQPLDPSHPLYAAAREALERQDEWDLQEHAAFWTAMLFSWPKPRGRRPVWDRLSAAAAHLHAHGVTDPREVTAALGVAPGTIRAAPSDSRRERPNAQLGADVLIDPLEPDQGLTLRRRARGRSIDGTPPLPRAYDDLDHAPAWTYLNPCLPEGVAASEDTGPLALAAAYLRERWAPPARAAGT
ncbi:MAG: hypothetical protein WKF96_11910 [Solirubrobacteraceae bacterium]